MRIFSYIDKLHEIPQDWTLDDKMYANIFLSTIHNIIFSNEKFINKFNRKDTAFKVPVQSLVEQHIHKQYKKVINWLVENEYVLADDHFIQYEKCKRYIINKDSSIYKNISMITEAQEFKQYNKFLERETKMRDRLTEGKLDNTFDIDILNYNRKLLQNGEVGFNSGGERLCKIGLNNLKKQTKLLKKGSKERTALATKHNKAHCDILTIMNRTGRISFDKQQARYFTRFTTLSNDFIKYITFQDKGFLQIDIKNSQPQFLNIEMIAFFPEEYEYNDEVRYVSDRIESGKIYDDIIENMKLNNTRREVKESIFQWFYSSVNEAYLFEDPTGRANKTELTKKIVKFFALEYPDFFHLIDNFKLSLVAKNDKLKDTGKLLARRLQKKESDIVKKIYSEVIMKHNIPCITKHDSFILPEDVPHNIIEKIMFMLREVGIQIGHNSIEYQRDLLSEREIEILGIGEEKIQKYVEPLTEEIITDLCDDDEILDVSIEDLNIFIFIARMGNKPNVNTPHSLRLENNKLNKVSREIIEREILLKTGKSLIWSVDDQIPKLGFQRIKFEDFLDQQK